jgi:hypothetical protein
MQSAAVRASAGALVGAALGLAGSGDPILAATIGAIVWVIAGAGWRYGEAKARRVLPGHVAGIEGTNLFFSVILGVVAMAFAVYGAVIQDFSLARGGVGIAALSGGSAYMWWRRLRDLQ